MKKQRTLSGLLALCLLLTLLPVGAVAEEPTPEETTAPAAEDTLVKNTPAEETQAPVVELAATVTIPEGGRLRPVRRQPDLDPDRGRHPDHHRLRRHAGL